MSSLKLQTLGELTPKPQPMEELAEQAEQTLITSPDKDKNIFHKKAYEEWVRDLKGDELMQFIECLDQVRH